MTLLLTENEAEELLDLPPTLEAVESVLRQHAEGRATNRARRRVALPTGGLNYMAAGAPEIGALGLKAYTVARTGARFYTMLFDPEGGELLSIMQSDRLGQVRTGAASGVAKSIWPARNEHSRHLRGGWQRRATRAIAVGPAGSSLQPQRDKSRKALRRRWVGGSGWRERRPASRSLRPKSS